MNISDSGKSTMKIAGVILALACLVGGGVSIGLKVTSKSVVANEPTSVDGSIKIPADYVSKFTQLLTDIEQGQAKLQKQTSDAQQILRIAMDRAGVEASEFPNYDYDKACVCIKKKVAGR